METCFISYHRFYAMNLAWCKIKLYENNSKKNILYKTPVLLVKMLFIETWLWILSCQCWNPLRPPLPGTNMAAIDYNPHHYTTSHFQNHRSSDHTHLPLITGTLFRYKHSPRTYLQSKCSIYPCLIFPRLIVTIAILVFELVLVPGFLHFAWLLLFADCLTPCLFLTTLLSILDLFASFFSVNY